MAKALLVDTNFSSVPIYNFLEKSGYEVFVCGNNPNDCIAKFSPNFHCIDYSDHQALQLTFRRCIRPVNNIFDRKNLRIGLRDGAPGSG
jgi:hypothetical protein